MLKRPLVRDCAAAQIPGEEYPGQDAPAGTVKFLHLYDILYL